MKWKHHVASKASDSLFLECTFPDETIAHYLMKLDKNKHQALLQALDSGREVNLEDFGTVLLSGWGPLAKD